MQDVSFAQRSRLRFECARLLRFARVVDLLIAETLAPCRAEKSVTIFVHLQMVGPMVGYGRLLLLSLLLLLFIFISELICLSKMCFDLKSLSCQTSRPEDE